MQRLTFRHCTTTASAVLVSGAMLLSACASSDKPADTSSVAGAMGPVTTTAGMAAPGAMPAMAKMTGDPDHDFLRMMSDHHKGLIRLAHMTKDRKDVGTAAQDAAKLDAEQDKELDHMMTMLEKDFKDAYAPTVMPEHRQMADSLAGMSGTAYERTFYQDVITHHQAAVTMVDAYLPTARNAMLKGMAQTMKADQQKEIAAFQRKVAKLGA